MSIKCGRLVVYCALSAALATRAGAVCSNARLVSTNLSHSTYFVSPGAGTTASATGSFWGLFHGDPGLGAGDDNGEDLATGNADPSLDWLRATSRGFYLAGAWSNGGVDGCVDNEPCPLRTVVAVSDQDAAGRTGYFLLSCVQADQAYNYDFSWFGVDLRFLEIARPVVTQTAPAGGALEIQVQGPSAAGVSAGVFTDGSCGGLEGLVTGYKVYYKRGTLGQSVVEDRRRSSGWIPATGATALGQSATFTVACDASCALYVAASLVFDSGFETDHLSSDFGVCPGAVDADHDGFAAGTGCGHVDCDDQRPDVHPGALEACNGIDDDCDGSTDEGAAVLCDDRNPCTDDSCAGVAGCLHTNNTAPCNDFSHCRTDGQCAGGSCQGGSPLDCNDQNPCTIDSCDPASQGCLHVSLNCNDCVSCSIDSCDANLGCVHTNTCDDHNPCTDDSCDPETGCVTTNNTAPCGNQCTTGGICGGGSCQPAPPLDCDDHDPCTVDQCSQETGCTHTPVSCSDDNPCTDDSCSPTAGCVSTPNDQNLCTDGNACTTDVCSGGLCTTSPLDCTDQDPCTNDTCAPQTGCGHTPVVCNDANACTDDACSSAAGGCVYVVDDTNTCSDGNACTTEVCSAGTCLISVIDCDDHDSCTDDSCNPAVGCLHIPDDTNTCSDGNACTAPDTCDHGVCGCNPSNVTSYASTTTVTIPTTVAVVTSTIVVGPGADPFLIRVRLTTNIRHVNNDDLDVTLTSPAGTVVTLTSDNGGSNDNVFNGTLWDGKADPGSQVPYTTNNQIVTDAGSFNNVTLTPVTAEESLGAFYGENPNGVWTLRISDDTSAAGGTLTGWGLELTTHRTPPVSVTTLFGQTTPLTLAEAPAVESSALSVSGIGRTLGKVRLRTNIRHTSPGDLDFTLTSPSGTVVTIATDAGGGSDNVFNGTLWDDGADPGNQVPFSAQTFSASNLANDTIYTNNVIKTTLVPEEGLAAFQGEDPNGIWTLKFSDDSTLNTGSLDSWQLEVTTVTFTCAADCNDQNPCTSDSCDPQLGCLHAPTQSSCSDGSACTTGDRCADGVCVGDPVSCDDATPCTNDACDPGTGCVHTPNSGNACSDGSICTTADHCAAGTCVGEPISCDDGDHCTYDACDTASGCYHLSTPPPVGNSVRASKTPTKVTLTWNDPPGYYNVYRGTMGIGAPPSYNQTCIASGLGSSSVSDAEDPPSRRFSYYLVSRTTFCAESELGRNGANQPIPNSSPCGTPPDGDLDGVPDSLDDCPTIPNPSQADTDHDGAGDACDNCPSVANSGQEDMDEDGLGDACDSDIDGDTVADVTDNCVYVPNADQADANGNGVGDACESLLGGRYGKK